MNSDPPVSPLAPSGQRRRILILSADYPVWDGGVAVWAERLAWWFHQAGHEVTVVTVRQLPGDADFDQRQPYRIVRLRNIKARTLKALYASWAGRRQLGRSPYDVVLATTWYPFGGALQAARARGIRTAVIAHGNDFLLKRWHVRPWRERMDRTFAAADHIIAVSKATAARVAQLWPADSPRIAVIHPGVEPAAYTFRPEPDVPGQTLLALGRLVARKGQDQILRAAARLHPEFPGLRVILAGRGTDQSRLEALTRELGVEKQVTFAGFVDDTEKLKLLADCSLYLMPSRESVDKGDFEGFGITYLEAGASGKPVIGGRSGGVEDAVEDGVTGLLVDPEDTEDLVAAVRRILGTPGLARQMGEAGRKRVEACFSWNHLAEQTAALLLSTGGRT